VAIAVVLLCWERGHACFSAALGRRVPISVTTPAVVLCLLLRALGCWRPESQTTGGTPALDTVVGYVVAALGMALPITMSGVHRARVRYRIDGRPARPNRATMPTLAHRPSLLMPVPTWRIDTLVCW
jgi:hypothetical protein